MGKTYNNKFLCDKWNNLLLILQEILLISQDILLISKDILLIKGDKEKSFEDIYIKHEGCVHIGTAILNSKVSFILFLVSKLTKIVENLYIYREDQISLFSTYKIMIYLNESNLCFFLSCI